MQVLVYAVICCNKKINQIIIVTDNSRVCRGEGDCSRGGRVGTGEGDCRRGDAATTIIKIKTAYSTSPCLYENKKLLMRNLS